MKEKQKQAKKDTSMIIFVTMLLLAVLLTFIYLGVNIWNQYRDSIINNQKEQMLTISKSMADNLEVFIGEYRADLDTLCQVSGEDFQIIKGTDWDFFAAYVDSHEQFVYDVWLENEQGEVIHSVRGYEPVECFSINTIDDRVSLREYKMKNDDFGLSVRRALPDGKALAIVLNAEAYYHDLISNVQLGTNGYMLLKDAEGIILMHPEKNQWGISVIEGRIDLYDELDLDLSSLEEMIEQQNRGETGTSEYYSYWWLKPELPRVKKISAYCPATLGESFIVVSAVIDYDDIYIPVVEGFLKLMLVFLGIVVALSFMGFYILYLTRQRQKVTEEITYLRELNRILEEMHRSEELIAHQQRLQIMGTMTGGIAHEFNNLLTPIMGYAELLMLDLPEESELYDEAFEIYEASMKAKEIIQQLSSLSRKNIETAYKTISVSRMLKRALKMVQSVCPTNVQLEDRTDFQDAGILGNETQMNQVILNICVNAIHAIGHPGGRIVVNGDIVSRKELDRYHLSKIPEEWSQYVRIDIRDDGCGMSQETIKQIFDPFFTTKKGGVGTGLGLALVEQIITSHKGYIFVESELGVGSVFHIYIPLNEQKQEFQYLMENENENNLTLLIVDDNPKVLKLLEKNFAKLKVETFTCMSFEEAKMILESHPVDALIMESVIEHKSAFDFCMAVLAKYPKLIKIVMTERITKELAEAKRRQIIDEYIDKPVSDSSIIEAIARHRPNLNDFS